MEMNIIIIKIWDFEELKEEYIFKTTLDIEKIFSGHGNLTPQFIEFLSKNNYGHLLNNYFNNHKNFEIDYWCDENIDEVIF